MDPLQLLMIIQVLLESRYSRVLWPKELLLGSLLKMTPLMMMERASLWYWLFRLRTWVLFNCHLSRLLLGLSMMMVCVWIICLVNDIIIDNDCHSSLLKLTTVLLWYWYFYITYWNPQYYNEQLFALQHALCAMILYTTLYTTWSWTDWALFSKW